MLVPVLLAALNTPVTECPAFPADDPATMVPSTGSTIVGIDVDAFAKTGTGRALMPALRSDLRFAEGLEVLEDCALALERSYALTVARDPGDGRMAILQARDIATDSTLQCLATEYRARHDGAEPWVRERSACHESLAFANGSRAWIINDYTLVWAAGSFVEPSTRRLAGAEPFALPPALDDEFARLDRSGHMWLAAELDEADRAVLPGEWASKSESLTAALDFSDGLRGVFTFSTANVASTANVRELLLVGFAQLAERLDAFGIEHRLRKQSGVAIVNGVVAAQVRLEASELLAIRRALGEQVRGRGPL